MCEGWVCQGCFDKMFAIINLSSCASFSSFFSLSFNSFILLIILSTTFCNYSLIWFDSLDRSYSWVLISLSSLLAEENVGVRVEFLFVPAYNWEDNLFSNKLISFSRPFFSYSYVSNSYLINLISCSLVLTYWYISSILSATVREKRLRNSININNDKVFFM